jgi:hypothetical protein
MAKLIGSIAPIDLATKELSMIPSNAAAMRAEFPEKRQAVADYGAPGPMPQQDVVGCHGHEMHPQKLVQLVGCHDSAAAKHEAAHRLH